MAAAALPPGSMGVDSNGQKHKACISCDDRKTASLLGGHTWNIVDGREEVYMRSVRNKDHYIDDSGRTTKHWMHQRRHIDLDGDGVGESLDSSNVQEVMRCPATAGKESAKAQVRQMRQLCQVTAPLDFGQYSARRSRTVAPPTPGRAGALDRRPPFQESLRERLCAPAVSARIVEKQLWTPRRGEPRAEARPGKEHAVFGKVDQIRAESHLDLTDSNFVTTLHSARRGSLGASGASAVTEAPTVRSMLGDDRPPKHVESMVRHSAQRVEALHCRQVSNWHHEQDKLKYGDPYHAKPVQQSGSSGVKYDIINNERRQFWY